MYAHAVVRSANVYEASNADILAARQAIVLNEGGIHDEIGSHKTV